jgi:hypothetical protein
LNNKKPASGGFYDLRSREHSHYFGIHTTSKAMNPSAIRLCSI